MNARRGKAFLRWLDALWVSVFTYPIPLIPFWAIMKERYFGRRP